MKSILGFEKYIFFKKSNLIFELKLFFLNRLASLLDIKFLKL